MNCNWSIAVYLGTFPPWFIGLIMSCTILDRLKCVHSSMCMTKKEATQEVSTWRWPGRMWPSALVDHGLWPSMTWVTATTPTVTQGWMPLSPWSLPSSSLRGLGRGGCGRASTTACHCHHWLSKWPKPNREGRNSCDDLPIYLLVLPWWYCGSSWHRLHTCFWATGGTCEVVQD